MQRTLLLLPALTLATTGLVACGNGDGDSVTTVEAAELIRSSPEAMADVGTAHMTMTIGVAGDSIEAEGDFDLDGERGAMTMHLPAPVDDDLEIVFDGTAYYMSTGAFGPLAGQLDADWVYIDLEAVAEMTGIDVGSLPTGGGTNNPASALEGLEGVSDDGVDDLGTEDVDGVSTHHYAAEIDMAAAIDQANEQSGGELFDEELADQFVEQFGDDPIPVEIWIDDDGLSRRMTMEIPAPGQDEPATMEMEMADFGEPVDIQVPDQADTIDFMDLLGSVPGGLPDN
jgi:hypothetical protein